MPDVACQYILAAPSGTINFNDGTADQFYITEIPSGLAGAPISAPIDPVAFANNSLSYNWWQRGRHIQMDGVFLITSTRNEQAILAIRNQMEETLRAALSSCAGLATAVATLSWTPYGQSGRVLEVRNDVPLECPHDQSYLVRTFSFGLFSNAAAWA